MPVGDCLWLSSLDLLYCKPQFVQIVDSIYKPIFQLKWFFKFLREVDFKGVFLKKLF